MIKYLIKKYWKAVVIAVFLFWSGWWSSDSVNDGMIMLIGMGFMIWMFRLIYLAQKGSPRIMPLAMSLFNVANGLWGIVTLKPLRKLIRRWLHVGLTQKPYPYLALYGSISDTQGMLFKLSPAIIRSKTPAACAILWRLIAREVLVFDVSSPTFRLGQWTETTADGVDRALEKTVYRFLQQVAAQNNGFVVPKELRKMVGYMPKRIGDPTNGYDFENQVQFADLLNTSVSIHSYNREEKKKMYGMKRFLKGLPKSLSEVAPETPIELRRVWPEYVAFGYVFGMGGKVLNKLATMQQFLSPNATLSMILNSGPHRMALDQLMTAMADGTPYAEDGASSRLGLLPLAWHADEFYDM